MLQHGELGRPFSRQLGPAGSRWVGQLSWVGPVGFHSRTTLSSEPAVTDRQGIGFGWLQNAWLLHARLKIHRGGIDPRLWPTQKTRGPVH